MIKQLKKATAFHPHSGLAVNKVGGGGGNGGGGWLDG